MRMIFIIPTLTRGGAERVISELANYYTDHGHEVSIVLWARNKKQYILDSRIKVMEFGSEFDSTFSKIKHFIMIAYKLRKHIIEYDPDAIISFLTKSNIITIVSSFFLKKSIYISERDSPDTWDKNSKIILLLRNLTYSKATGFLAQSNEAQQVAMQRFGISNIKKLPNPIRHIDIISNIEKENIILNIGRLEEQKGQRYLLEMFSRLRCDNWKLVILGEGSLRKDLEIHCKQLNITDKVEMPGSVHNVDEWLAKASIFAFPSLHEGFPNALLEAMGVGLPCVSFDCKTGPSELIDNDKNAFLVPLNDFDLFSKRLQQLIDDKSLRDKLSDEAKIMNEKYNIEKISNDLFEFINSKRSK